MTESNAEKIPLNKNKLHNKTDSVASSSPKAKKIKLTPNKMYKLAKDEGDVTMISFDEFNAKVSSSQSSTETDETAPSNLNMMSQVMNDDAIMRVKTPPVSTNNPISGTEDQQKASEDVSPQEDKSDIVKTLQETNSNFEGSTAFIESSFQQTIESTTDEIDTAIKPNDIFTKADKEAFLNLMNEKDAAEKKEIKNSSLSSLENVNERTVVSKNDSFVLQEVTEDQSKINSKSSNRQASPIKVDTTKKKETKEDQRVSQSNNKDISSSVANNSNVDSTETTANIETEVRTSSPQLDDVEKENIEEEKKVTNLDVSSAENIELGVDKNNLSVNRVDDNHASVKPMEIDDDSVKEPPFLKLTKLSTENICIITSDNKISNYDFLTRQLSETDVNRNSRSSSDYTRNQASSKADQRPTGVATRLRSSRTRQIGGRGNKVSSEDSKKAQKVEKKVQSEVADLHAVDSNDNGDSVEENLQNEQMVSFVFNSCFRSKS